MAKIPRIAVERAMTIQEVILMAMAKKLTWIEASQVLGYTDCHMRRVKAKYEREGFHGLYDGRCGKLSPRRISSEVVEEVLRLYRKEYFDFNVVHFHEKLVERHGFAISYTWTKSLLQKSGLVAREPKRGVHPPRRSLERSLRPAPGWRLRCPWKHLLQNKEEAVEMPLLCKTPEAGVSHNSLEKSPTIQLLKPQSDFPTFPPLLLVVR